MHKSLPVHMLQLLLFVPLTPASDPLKCNHTEPQGKPTASSQPPGTASSQADSRQRLQINFTQLQAKDRLLLLYSLEDA